MNTTRRSLASKAFAHLRKFWKRRKEASNRAARRGFFFEPLENRSLLAADFLAIPDQTVLHGAPLWLGVDGTSSVSSPITYTVTSSNPNVVAVTVPTGNKTLVVNVANFGTMKFQLFDNLAPRAATAIENLANAGFYNGLTFHRILNDFVIQGGAADGAGGPNPNVPDFDDQYNPDLQFTSPGVIAMAKGLDDSNDTQFFITDTVNPPTTNFPRHLDFNHTIFGKLTEGESVRQAISNVAANGSGTPSTPVIITSATVLNSDPENTAFMLKALASSGSADITITANDGQGGTATRTFHVTVTPDTSNGNPFLSDIPTVKATVGAISVPIQLQGNDVEGDAIYYDATKIGSVNYTVTVDHATGLVTVTPPVGFVGSFDVQVSAKALAQQNTADSNQAITDVQKVKVNILPTAPTGLDLLAASDTGTSSSDNVTNAASLQFQVSGVTSGAVVRLYEGTNVLAQTTASGTTAVIIYNNIATLGEGVHNFTMSQEVSGQESAKSAPLAVTYDVTPPGAFTSTATTTAETDTLYTYDTDNASPNAGIVYSLSPGLTGATINSSTGVVSWTPSVAQIGAQTFGIVASDAAGNTISQGVSVTVAQAVTKVAELSLSITDATANRQPITALHVGDNFYLRGSVRDLRTTTVQGVYALFADLNYDPAKVQVTGAVEFNGGYLVATSGDTTTSGLVNEVGAVSSSTVPVNAGLKLMFEIPMKVLAGGQFSFTTDPADVSPSHDVLLFGQDPVVPTAAVKYGSLTLSVDTTFTAVNDTFNVNEDAINSPLAVLSNDTIVPGSGNVLTILSVGPRDHAGTVTISADAKSLLYTPAPNYNGPETFTYTVKNQNNETSTATVTVQVAPVNDPPTAAADTFSVPGESTGNVLNVLQNDSSLPDTGETLRVNTVTQGNHGGSVQIGSGGTFVNYSPAPNFEGTETFTYFISDGNGSAQATATVTVSHTNHNPVAVADTATVLEDSGATTISVLANDNTGIDTGETLTITGKGTPNHGGTVTIAADLKSLAYTPAANFQGTETFTYTISDGNGGTATGAVTVTVTNVNDAPTAVADTLTGFKNTANVFDVLANDLSAPDPVEIFSIQSVTQPSHGTVTITNNGTRVTYTPTTDYTGSDSFTYTMQDPGGLTSTATATVNVQDFIPSKLGGRVFIDSNGNGVFDGMDSGVEKVQINLTGTPTGGQASSQTLFTQADGTYLFENLAPGSYKLKQVQPAFLTDGPDYAGTQGGTLSANDEITISLNQNVSGTANNFSELGKPIALTRIEEYFATNIGHNTQAAATFNGTSPIAPTWQTVVGDQWSQFHDFKFALANNGQSLQVNVQNSQNQPLRATVSLTDTSLVLTLGQQADGSKLFKLVGDPANFHFATVTNTSPTAAADAITVAPGATVSVNVASNDSDSDGTLNLTSLAITQAPTHGTATKNNDGTVTYVHNGSAGASDSFKYTIADNQGAVSNESLVTISINQLPVANNDSATLAAGATQTINVATNDTDSGGSLNLASIVIVTQPTHGNVAVNTDGTVTYQHNNSATTTDSFSYKISDNQGAQSAVAAVVSITVTPVNSSPTAANDLANVAVGGVVSFDVAANDTDTDGTIALSSILVTQNPAHGTVSANLDGTVTYTHDGSQTTSDSFKYTIKDNQGAASSPATVSIIIAASNSPPLAVADSATLNEGGSTAINVTANDTDADSTIDLTSIVITQNPANGTLTVNSNGTVTYTHNGSETTSDSFSYNVKDIQGAVSNNATVSITVTPTNDAPVAVNDTAAVDEGAPLDIDLAANDTDVDSVLDPTSIVIIQNPAQGSVVVQNDGTVTYTHSGTETTSDSFVYSIRDAQGLESGAGTVSITVTPVNDAPFTVFNAATVEQGDSVTVNVTTNDIDVDGTVDVASVVITQNPAHGTVVVHNDGTVTYTHDGSATTSDTFAYTIKDNLGLVSDFANVNITVVPVNNPPTAVDDLASVAEGATANINVASNDTDTDGTIDLTSIVITQNPAHGTLTVNNDGTVDYTHDGSEFSSDSFKYTISDNSGAISATATVSITVTPVNDAPIPAAEFFDVTEDSGVATTGDVLLNDSDPEGTSLVVSAVAGQSANVGNNFAGLYGTFHIESDGSFTYTLDDLNPTVDALNELDEIIDSIAYEVSDGQLTSPALASVRIHGHTD